MTKVLWEQASLFSNIYLRPAAFATGRFPGYGVSRHTPSKSSYCPWQYAAFFIHRLAPDQASPYICSKNQTQWKRHASYKAPPDEMYNLIVHEF